MQISTLDRSSQARYSALVSVVAAALLVGCVDEGQGLTDPLPEGSAGTPAGGTKNTSAGSGAGGQDAADNGGAAGMGDDEPRGGSELGGTPGMVAGGAGSGGTGEPEAGAGSDAGAGGEGGVHIAPACPFHSAPAPATGGTGGTGGVGPSPETPSITIQLSPFVGSYLADTAGRSLYTYGADLPGDCSTPPQSLCIADCVVSWPPFDAGARVLPATLTDAGFGTIQRSDGGYQTTYMGWPLYYYKSDLTLGQMTGQGKAKIWHIAEVTLPSVTIMKLGAVKYLADGAGRTLYVSAADQQGTADSDPVSNCAGECLATFAGFREKNLSVVSSLEPLDFSVFVRRGAGGLQLAYKGMPLYRAATDLKSGDMNGTAVAGFTAALP
jgi:predicted lipoprotein with Yx(FWY)xxD motif